MTISFENSQGGRGYAVSHPHATGYTPPIGRSRLTGLLSRRNTASHRCIPPSQGAPPLTEPVLLSKEYYPKSHRRNLSLRASAHTGVAIRLLTAPDGQLFDNSVDLRPQTEAFFFNIRSCKNAGHHRCPPDAGAGKGSARRPGGSSTLPRRPRPAGGFLLGAMHKAQPGQGNGVDIGAG